MQCIVSKLLVNKKRGTKKKKNHNLGKVLYNCYVLYICNLAKKVTIRTRF